MAQAHSAPLTGYRIAVTSARRAEELCALLRRQGAEVCSAPAIKMIALPDDDELQNNTEALIADPPDILVAHTGIGFRGWLAAAEGGGWPTSSWNRCRRPGSSPADQRQLVRCVPPACVKSGPPTLNRRMKCWNICSNRGVPYAYCRPAARCRRQLGPVSGISGRVTFRRRASGADPGLPVEAGATRRRVRPFSHRDRATTIRRGHLHVGTCRSRGARTQP